MRMQEKHAKTKSILSAAPIDMLIHAHFILMASFLHYIIMASGLKPNH